MNRLSCSRLRSILRIVLSVALLELIWAFAIDLFSDWLSMNEGDVDIRLFSEESFNF
jgi:hypothetical protein